MNHLDLFSGIGGFSLGLQQAGIEPDWIGYSDIDKYANEIFQRRFPNARRLGSITDVRPNDLPNIDLITFGFPCQDLSLAGKRGGLSANRSSLFFKAIDLVAAKRPKYFIFENVKGLFSSNKGKDFDLVLQAIADIGYDGQWQLLNTRWFLPQNRERVYFVGHIRGECRPKVFPIREDGYISNKSQGETQKEGERIRSNNPQSANCISARYYKDGSENLIDTGLNQIGVVGKDSMATRVYSTNGVSKTLTDGGGMGAKTGLYRVHCTQTRNPNRPSLTRKCDCGSNKLYQKCCGTGGGTGLISKDDGTTYCLDTANTQAVELEKSNIRRLTPTECERLQGFPDGWTKNQSDTQRYKQLGNAVTVPVVKAVMKRLYNAE